MSETEIKKKRKRGVQWAAQYLAAAELERNGYDVPFTAGNATPVMDLVVTHAGTGEGNGVAFGG
jgi:hypothetical protein